MIYIVLIMISMTILGISVGIGIGYHIAENKYLEMIHNYNRRCTLIYGSKHHWL